MSEIERLLESPLLKKAGVELDFQQRGDLIGYKMLYADVSFSTIPPLYIYILNAYIINRNSSTATSDSYQRNSPKTPKLSAHPVDEKEQRKSVFTQSNFIN